MKAVILLHRWTGTKSWWATVRPAREDMETPEYGWLCYDSAPCPSRKAALKEAKAFCRWKELRVVEVREEE